MLADTPDVAPNFLQSVELNRERRTRTHRNYKAPPGCPQPVQRRTCPTAGLQALEPSADGSHMALGMELLTLRHGGLGGGGNKRKKKAIP